MLKRPQDIFRLASGDRVTKRNLFDLIQYSKIVGSDYWGGRDFSIGNTPQQGINWIGAPPGTKGVIIKTRPGSYEGDGWLSDNAISYRYSFKARKSVVSYTETANSVLISQPHLLYPVFLFSEQDAEWIFEGRFSIAEIADLWVVLERENLAADTVLPIDEEIYREGGRKYVTHLMVERSRALVDFVKASSHWICDICSSDFAARYGVEYIEAHHKTPISTLTSEHRVRAEDLVLLCPNCHKAVHIIMKQSELDYDEIRRLLIERKCASSGK